MPVIDMFVEAFRLDLAAKLLAAILVGGAIGLERELRHKPAGLRTNILICMGSALLMDLSMGITVTHGGDPGRIAAQVVTGIGFLGAGTILHTRGQITGLTSAATIWVVAALGLTIGAGHYVEAMGASALTVVVLMGLGWVEGRFISQMPSRPGGGPSEDWVPRAPEGRRAVDRRGIRREPTGEQPSVRPDQRKSTERRGID